MIWIILSIYLIQTPLHRADQLGKRKCVEVLLLHGADKTLRNVFDFFVYSLCIL